MSLIAAVFLTFQVGAFASPVPGWAEFAEGQYDLSRQIARESDTADGYAQACRAGLVIGGFMSEGKAAIDALHSAVNDCDKALKKDPDHLIGKMSLAIALSFEGKRLSRPSYPKKARVLLEQLVATYPDNPLGYGALAAWHSEVSAAGFFARIALGARRKTAAALFEKAESLGGTDYALRFEYVKFLARGKSGERQLALTKAEELINRKPETTFDAKLRDRCQQLLTALKTGSKRTIKETLQDIGAFQDALAEDEAARYPLNTLSVSSQS